MNQKVLTKVLSRKEKEFRTMAIDVFLSLFLCLHPGFFDFFWRAYSNLNHHMKETMVEV